MLLFRSLLAIALFAVCCRSQWTEDTSVGSTKAWYSVASSADGTKLVAAVYQGNLWTSTDSGGTWTEDTSVGSTKTWNSVASSADGTKLVAAVQHGNLWMKLPFSCTRPAAVTDAKYTITENDLAIASFNVALACKAGYSSTGTPTANACTSAGDYTVTNPCTANSCTATEVTNSDRASVKIF